ncbi:MAG: phosphatidylserine decarboxylase [Woeseiaceae bacterium]
MQGRRNPFVAREGLPFVVAAVVAIFVLLRYADPLWAILPAVLLPLLLLIFRDPRRPISSSPRGIVSPVDGDVVAIDVIEEGALQGKAIRIKLRIDALGTYTARCPMEGKIMDLRAERGGKTIDYPTNALWIQSDEGDDIVLYFAGYRFGLAPRSFIRYGERLGQGQRCAYLRLTRFAEVHLPADSRVLVSVGDTMQGGRDLLAKVTH